jgi:hypothetical protein
MSVVTTSLLAECRWRVFWRPAAAQVVAANRGKRMNRRRIMELLLVVGISAFACSFHWRSWCIRAVSGW